MFGDTDTQHLILSVRVWTFWKKMIQEFFFNSLCFSDFSYIYTVLNLDTWLTDFQLFFVVAAVESDEKQKKNKKIKNESR